MVLGARCREGFLSLLPTSHWPGMRSYDHLQPQRRLGNVSFSKSIWNRNWEHSHCAPRGFFVIAIISFCLSEDIKCIYSKGVFCYLFYLFSWVLVLFEFGALFFLVLVFFDFWWLQGSALLSDYLDRVEVGKVGWWWWVKPASRGSEGERGAGQGLPEAVPLSAGSSPAGWSAHLTWVSLGRCLA